MRLRELSVKQGFRIVSRHRYEKGHKHISSTFKGPKTSIVSIIFKWYILGTNKRLLIWLFDKGLWSRRKKICHCEWVFFCEIWCLQSDIPPQTRALWWSGQTETICRQKALYSLPKFAEMHLNDSVHTKSNLVW